MLDINKSAPLASSSFQMRAGKYNRRKTLGGGTAMYVFEALLVGFFAIGLTNMFGIGGATIATPALRLFLGASAAIALGTTLPVTIPAAVAGTITYYRNGLVQKRTAFYCSLGGIFGAVGGALLTRIINLDYLMIVTGLVILYIALVTARRGIKGEPAEGREQETGVTLAPRPREQAWLIVAIGIAGGIFSGLLGIGGGTIMVPFLLYLLHMPLKQAFATSLAAIAVIAIPGTIVHSFLHHISWSLALYLIIGSIPAAYLGAHITIRTAEKLLYILFSALLFAFGTIFIINEILILVR
jgi:uncharacterized membrane protein YfcA